MNDVQGNTRGRARRILTFGGVALALLFPLLAVVNYLWLVSGTNEWKLRDDRNGIRIWTQKTPGNPLLKGRAQFQVRSTLGGIVKIVYDREVHRANNMMNVNFIEAQHSPGYFGVFNSFRQDMPGPLQAREFVLLSEHVQDPKTKAIELNAMAAPNKIPPSDCCVRIVHLHNRYTVTPRGDGYVDIDFFWDIDLGGALPYALQNVALPGALYKAMDDFRNLIAKYNGDTVDYIAEPGAARLGDMKGFVLSQQR
jgi:hypothetical protein